jgi:predicted nuclease of predicted toxin-antitoxin system
MPLPPAIAAWLVDQGHDAVHATDLRLHRAPDSEIVARAKHEARTIITADLDYPRLLAVARASEPSLILFRTGDWTEAEVRRRLGSILSSQTAEDITQSIIVVDSRP